MQHFCSQCRRHQSDPFVRQKGNRMPAWFSSPSTQPEDVLMGLGAPVEVRTDHHGVSHLYAKSEEDLFRAQGFVTARDRLFQMDIFRRFGAGRLSELFGDVPAIGLDPSLHLRGNGLSSVDYMMRVLGLQQAAEEGLAWCSPRTHRSLLAYAEGVNEYIHKARLSGERPLGYQMLGEDIEEWRPLDSLLILRLYGLRLGFAWRLLLAFGAVCDRLSGHKDKLQSLLPPHLSLSMGWQQSPEGLFHAVEPEAAQEGPPTSHIDILSGTGQGSCAWVVAGNHVQSGRPVLCHDPHFLIRIPPIYHQIRLSGGEYNTIGMVVPGVCGVMAGHNDEISWGHCLMRADDADIFLEDVDEATGRFQYQSRQLPLIRREEVIRVRGEPAKHRWVRATQHGPLLSDALRGPLPAHLHYSLKWTGHEGTREAEAILLMNRAKEWSSFREALRYARVPAMGYVYADRQGNIGAAVAGAFPSRPDSPRVFRPLDASDAKHLWHSCLPFEELPSVYNPEKGYIILAGQKPDWVPESQKLPCFWQTGERAERIEQLLIRHFQGGISEESVLRLLRDQYCLWSRDWIQKNLKPYLPHAKLDSSVRDMLQLLVEWNGRTGADSIATSFFAAFQREFIEAGLQPHLGESLYRRWSSIASELELPLEPLFRDNRVWFDQSQHAVLDRTLTLAFDTLSQQLGPDPQGWQWNKLHRLTLRPLFFWDGGLQARFTQGPFPTGGTGRSIHTGEHLWGRPHFEHLVGALARQVIFVGEWEHSRWVLCGGQSEQPDSPHYTDQLDLWRKGEFHTMSFASSPLPTMSREILASKPSS